MKYPVWFPYPISWGRALLALTWMSVFLYGVWFFGAWSNVIGFLTNDAAPSLRVLWVGICSFILAFASFYGSLKEAIDHKKSRQFHIFSLRNLWEGVYCLIVVISTLINAMVMISAIYDVNHHSFYYYEISDQQAVLIFLSMWITAAYFYQLEYLARQYLSRFKKAFLVTTQPRSQKLLQGRSTPKQLTHRTIDPVELELNRMKGELGLTNMKSVRSTPGSRAGSKPVSKPASKPAPKPSKRQS